MYFICPTCKLYSESSAFTCPICNCDSIILNVENCPEGYMRVEQVIQAGNAWIPNPAQTKSGQKHDNDSQASKSKSEHTTYSPFFDEQGEPAPANREGTSNGQDNPFFTESDYEDPVISPHPIEMVSASTDTNDNSVSLGTIRRNQQTKWTLQEFLSWCKRNEVYRKVLIILALVFIVLIALGIWNNRENLFTSLLSGLSSLLPAALFVIVIVYAIKKLIKP